ncbi:hypothetical protein WBG78_07095 [Chryseolinea sp. T2]|uniref:hypothetical protein n=1 Tax=Chryseolinea sp. T2 TaxID=3129255 RepID=UPI0030769E3D
MKNPFFNLPDIGGDLLDFRLALRLIVRQAFKPMLGHVNTTTRHAVAPVYKTAFIPSLKQTLRDKFQFISQTAQRLHNMFPAQKPAAKVVPGKSVTKSVAGKSFAAKPIAGKQITKRQAKPMGKSLHKAAANGKRIAANTQGNKANAQRVAGNAQRVAGNVSRGNGNVQRAVVNTPRVVHPATAPTEKTRDGMWVEYNKHAVVIARGNYDNNLKTGLWREYYDTGELMIEEHFVQGVQHGRFATFHPNGQCCSDGMYDQGRREGQFFLYDESGRHVRSLTFKHDVLIEDVLIEERLAMA